MVAMRHAKVARKVFLSPGDYIEEETGQVWLVSDVSVDMSVGGNYTKNLTLRSIEKSSLPSEAPEPDMPPPPTAKNAPALDPIRKRISMDFAVLMKKHLNLDTVPTAMLDEIKELFEFGMDAAVVATSSTADRINRHTITGALQAMLKRADEHNDETIEMAPGVWKYAVKEMLTKLKEI